MLVDWLDALHLLSDRKLDQQRAERAASFFGQLARACGNSDSSGQFEVSFGQAGRALFVAALRPISSVGIFQRRPAASPSAVQSVGLACELVGRLVGRFGAALRMAVTMKMEPAPGDARRPAGWLHFAAPSGC